MYTNMQMNQSLNTEEKSFNTHTHTHTHIHTHTQEWVPFIKILSLSGCVGLKIFDRLIYAIVHLELQYCDLSSDDVTHVCALINLKRLSIAGNETVSTDAIAGVVCVCVCLEVLDVSSVGGVNDVLASVSIKLNRLIAFKVANCKKIDDEGVRLVLSQMCFLNIFHI
eukprot:GHVR01147276.1.p1 GENE.GHVR01147276.1~~GHVR01147276.1.p1  ORF type:complete len:167 (+),score=66.03 GHVR01147276.1:77-577(+)